MLRNRGFALDGAEEVLRGKLRAVEARVADPGLNGRSEEVWARMVGVRERVRGLRRELERVGGGGGEGGGGGSGGHGEG